METPSTPKPLKKLFNLSQQSYDALEQWAVDLESGQFTQTEDVLYDRSLVNGGYCCLGVCVRTYERLESKSKVLESIGDVATESLPKEVQTYYNFEAISTKDTTISDIISDAISNSINSEAIHQLISDYLSLEYSDKRVFFANDLFSRLNDVDNHTFKNIAWYIRNFLLANAEIVP